MFVCSADMIFHPDICVQQRCLQSVSSWKNPPVLLKVKRHSFVSKPMEIEMYGNAKGGFYFGERSILGGEELICDTLSNQEYLSVQAGQSVYHIYLQNIL